MRGSTVSQSFSNISRYSGTFRSPCLCLFCRSDYLLVEISRKTQQINFQTDRQSAKCRISIAPLLNVVFLKAYNRALFWWTVAQRRNEHNVHSFLLIVMDHFRASNQSWSYPHHLPLVSPPYLSPSPLSSISPAHSTQHQQNKSQQSIKQQARFRVKNYIPPPGQRKSVDEY